MVDVTPGDLLVGARAIAEFFGWNDQAGERRVRHWADTGKVPIWKEPGLGLAARRSTLQRYIEQQEKKALERSHEAA